MLKNVKCARCVKCGREYEAAPNLTNCACGGILDIIYDYDYIKKNLTKEKLKTRPNTMWRYRELLPVEETTEPTPLRVGWSPLYEEPRLADPLGLKRLWVQDDGPNPTESLKGRASAIAVACVYNNVHALKRMLIIVSIHTLTDVVGNMTRVDIHEVEC